MNLIPRQVCQQLLATLRSAPQLLLWRNELPNHLLYVKESPFLPNRDKQLIPPHTPRQHLPLLPLRSYRRWMLLPHIHISSVTYKHSSPQRSLSAPAPKVTKARQDGHVTPNENARHVVHKELVRSTPMASPLAFIQLRP
ncbi:hypothetical protein, unlikely [Trypanosoma brucei gambiense DAL972]|uniref:Uncharacterized protein n=1 Tax=Trypanosoma brucei gambiense (strain MHOM/CI/86/DAL972) TaxID=679716 RepID=D0A4J6_TRYB9|nr:hypothetical protein, unlikely [Trypanosoma brucei gambiense DAL972]CBH16190.1 hypothetical protein, unlikely [Trypanosoma brucei gambiense DAL972]|eukprot:XP_011778454.1 hypothetical protein, unlikely [Trypanosoma brucei gambiense DAL972]